MKTYIITIKDNELSEQAVEKCIASTNIEIEKFNAITPEIVENFFEHNELAWTYPWEEERYDFATGLKLSPYNTINQKARISCFASHFALWKKCIVEGPLLILEHDAIFIKNFDPDFIENSNFGIVSINDPRGATRKAMDYHEKVQASKNEISIVPTIDDLTVPQGLPGNSAYVIKPAAAAILIDKVYEHGAWPNDAIMCKQIMNNLGVSKTYYTKVQGTKSTTSL